MTLNTIRYLKTFVRKPAHWVVLHSPERGSFLAYLVALALIGIALFARLELAPINAGLQYVTFFPAVTLAAVICGFWPGVLVTLIGVLLASYIFTPPYFSFGDDFVPDSLWSNVVFLVDGIIVCSTIEAMHRYRLMYVEELNEARRQQARVAAINQALDEFTYIAAHDLKEPLRGIHNYASFLKEDYGDRLDGEGRQYTDSIQRLAMRMTAMIDSLMTYSRLGSAEPGDNEVDVDAIVDAVAEDLGRLWREDGVELRRNGPLGKVRGDAGRIGAVFQNLISNAAKYNDKPAKWIEIGCDRRGSQPVFYVRDNGIGIAPSHQESIFRIFKRLHERDKFGGGTGAGLTIVKKIVERCGGRIWLESVPGEGSVFYFSLNGEA